MDSSQTGQGYSRQQSQRSRLQWAAVTINIKVTVGSSHKRQGYNRQQSQRSRLQMVEVTKVKVTVDSSHKGQDFQEPGKRTLLCDIS